MLSDLRQMAVKAKRIAHQNLFWAFFYNFLGIFFAITGSLSPLFAVFAVFMSSTMVILNAQRLRFFKKLN